MEAQYQIFGSKNSLDLDVCFFVEKLSSIKENHETIAKYIMITNFNTYKKVNANLAVLKDGIVMDCFKGTPDELNNALFFTYHLHKQNSVSKINKPVQRHLVFRIERCARVIVSYFTRTDYRGAAKKALKGNLLDRLEFLSKLNLEQISEFGKQGSVIEIYKSIAFQLGITLALFEEEELYTKECVIDLFPELKHYVLRVKSSSASLEKYLKRFVIRARLEIEN